MTGLPAGDYLLRTTLELEGADVSATSTGGIVDRDYRWDIYLGDGVRPRDAKTITLKDGEESNGNDIEIPVAKLHSISALFSTLRRALRLTVVTWNCTMRMTIPPAP